MYALPVARSNSLADLAARIKAEHKASSESLRDSVAHATACGKLLIEAKAQLGHGQWLPWLRTHCGMSARTAQIYMQLAKLDPNAQRVADLPLRRAVLHLRRLDRREQVAARREQARVQWAEKQRHDAIKNAALDAVYDQLDPLVNPPEPPCGYPDCGCDPWCCCSQHPQEIVLAIVAEQLDAIDEARAASKARRADAIDCLVTQIVAAVREVDYLGVTVQDVIDALGHRTWRRPTT
jgi:hypothetical protein